MDPLLGVTGKRVVQKNRQQVINKFYDEIASTINNFEGIEGIIIAGPGFGKMISTISSVKNILIWPKFLD